MTDDFGRSHRSGDGAAAKSGGDDIASPGKKSLTSLTEGSSGGPLPDSMRGGLERGMGGQDLSDVKVHVDDKAAQAASALNAKAFTVGQAIYFGAGQYDPGSTSGQKLIAHETAHTVQQKGATQTAQLASLDISTPGDRHETEAESFAESYVGGGKAGPITPVSTGVVQRAVIQRDLLDGSPPPAFDQPSAPIDIKQPTPAELAEKASDSIKKARGEGGTQAVVSKVHELRRNAPANAKGAIESAISAELSDDEKEALSGGGDASKKANAPAPTTQDPPPAGKDVKGAKAGDKTADPHAAKDDKHATDGKHAADGKGTGSQDAKDGAAKDVKETKETKGDAAKEGGDAKEGGAKADAAGGDHDAKPGAQQGHGKTKGDKGGEHGAGAGGAKAGGAAHAAAGDHGVAAGGGEHAAAGGEHQEIPAQAGRELIEAELAFHDRWKVYQGGAGDRATHLMRTLFYADGPGGVGSNIMNGDLTRGMMGASVFVGANLAIKLAATKTPLSRIPGVGNIIGGGLAAYNLFHGGGAGIKDMASHAVHGIGSALSVKNWKESPFLTAANLIEGISGVLEIVGSVCNILSGLAYAFAAIAAIGGLLSIFFPPLAFLVPYIPVAINFGRACGGIATVCAATVYLLSPLIAIFRALHQIFSDQDPVKLAAEEDEYHSAAQGAISTYGSTIVGAKIDQHGIKPLGLQGSGEAPKKVLGSVFVGENLKEAGEGIKTFRSTTDGGLANTRQALGSDRSAREVSKDYFNPTARTQVAQTEHHREENKLEKQEGKLETAKKDQAYVERRADQAVARRDADPSAQNVRRAESAARTADRHEARVGDQQARVNEQHHRVERAETRTQIPLGRQGELGKDGAGGIGGEFAANAEWVFDDAMAAPSDAREERVSSAAEGVLHNSGGGAQGGPGGHGGGGDGGNGGHGGEHAPLDAKGHIILPPPPGRLQEVDAIDQEIQKLENEKKELHATGADARATQQDAAKRAGGLKAGAADVKQYVTNKQTHSKQEQGRIQTQTTDLQTKSAQASGKMSQGTNQASLPIRGVAGAARTVDGLLQKVPSNKFFDISSAKNNVHKFVVGMDEIMGADGKNQQTQGQANAVIADRNQKTQQAAQKNTQATAAGNQLATTMTQDAATAQTSATQAGAIADQAREGEAGHESKIQQLRSDRQQKWQSLLGWAAQHRSLRESATKAEH